MDFIKERAMKNAKEEAHDTLIDKFVGDKPLIKQGVEKIEECFKEPEPEPTLAEKAVDTGLDVAKGIFKRAKGDDDGE